VFGIPVKGPAILKIIFMWDIPLCWWISLVPSGKAGVIASQCHLVVCRPSLWPCEEVLKKIMTLFQHYASYQVTSHLSASKPQFT